MEFHKPCIWSKLPTSYKAADGLYVLSYNERDVVSAEDVARALAGMNPKNGATHTLPKSQTVSARSAASSLWTAENISVKVVGVLPIILNPVTQYSIVYIVLKYINTLLSKIIQPQIMHYLVMKQCTVLSVK